MRDFGQLVLADGSVYVGNCSFEGNDSIAGELVFSTSNLGYTEIASDPSYFGQIVVLANPEVGNYGVNLEDMQSSGIKVKALVVRNLSGKSSSFRSQMTLTDWFLREGVPIFYGIDTRSLILHIRNSGSMMAVISKEILKSPTTSKLCAIARELPSMSGVRLSQKVMVRCSQVSKEESVSDSGFSNKNYRSNARVVVLDFGVKRAILRYLHRYFSEVVLIPGSSSLEEVWAHNPHGVLISNGPGDPKTETQAVKLVRSLLGRIPIFGICLGHQILSQALGLSTYKLKYGHRGSNQAVKSCSGQVMITCQNHGFAVEMKRGFESLNTDVNISDSTNEGIEIREMHAFSTQYHPEGAPGPCDAEDRFRRFSECVMSWNRENFGGRCVEGAILADGLAT